MSGIDNVLSRDQGELHQMRYIVRNGYNVVWEYDSATDDLREWLWPIHDDGPVVPPSELREYRLTHQFRGPHCFCSRLGQSSERRANIEVAMFMPTHGARGGKYVARCARDKCGYEVVLENLYTRSGLRVSTYPKRAIDEEKPPTVFHVSETEKITVTRPVKRAYDMLALSEDWKPPLRSPRKRLRLNREILRTPELQRLESPILPGLTRLEFRSLFRRCPCGLVTTRAAFARHQCIKQPGNGSRGESVDVIDLTRDASGSDAEETHSQASTVTDVQ